MSKNKSIYDLGLHESTLIAHGSMNVTRVPGGWIYDNWDLERDRPKKGTFVPFNLEFINKVEDD